MFVSFLCFQFANLQCFNKGTQRSPTQQRPEESRSAITLAVASAEKTSEIPTANGLPMNETFHLHEYLVVPHI